MNITEKFKSVLDSLDTDVKYRISELNIIGAVVDGARYSIEIDWLVSGDPDVNFQRKKRFPAGEENHEKIIRELRVIKEGDVELDLEKYGIGKKFNTDGVKHIYNYVAKTETPFVEIKEKKKSVKKIDKKEEVKDGESSIDG